LLTWLLADGEWWTALAVALPAGVGFVDDRGKEHGRDLRARSKGAVLVLAAAIGAAAVFDPIARPIPWLAVALFVFVVTNATNFLDNMNGVAAAIAAVGLLTLPGPTWTTAAGCSALAFVPFNWPRARVFLGDAGAYALGAALALACARASTRVPIPQALAGCALPLLDFTQVVLARLWLGHPPWVGDRRHLTHIAVNLGLHRTAVAPLLAALAGAFALAGQLLAAQR
jgi:UDP-N-acetylmuramyl pentapeptide phosphotransferase/UDP-N-acetylglucosamine-1-phosphate transferase